MIVNISVQIDITQEEWLKLSEKERQKKVKKSKLISLNSFIINSKI